MKIVWLYLSKKKLYYVNELFFLPRHRGLGGKYLLGIYSDEKVEGSNPGEVFLLLLFGF